MKVFFTSDTHFGSKRTLELSKRPFNSVEEMDEQMISNWNSIVEKDDIVYHLGDFGNYETIRKLNGNIILLFGNYEHREILSVNHLLELGFKEVDTWKKRTILLEDIKSDTYKEDNLYLNMAHEPSNINNHYCKNEFNIFGHIHKLQMVKRFGLNVGVDCHNFKPIDLDTVLFYRNAIINFYDDEVFMQ